MRTTIIFISALAASILVFSSCGDDKGDTTPPVIKINAPAEGANLRIGNTGGIHLDMDLSDDEALGSYTVEIHINDGHTHTRADGGTTDFFYKNTWNDIAGMRNKNIHHHEIAIPAGATPGDYHFIVYCADRAGNESHAVRNIVLSADGGDDKDHAGER